jgi:hypothetical protein
VAGLGGLMATAIPTYEKVEAQTKSLAAAMTAHKESLQALQPEVQAAIADGVSWGQNADAVRATITQLTEAGLSWAQVQQALPAVYNLSIAKNMDLSAAATQVSQALYGSGKALKQFGILLPPVSVSAADLGKATSGVATAHTNLSIAEQELGVVEDKLRGKHHLTAAEALTLEKAHLKVTDAQGKLKTAQDKLTLAQQGGVDKGARLKTIVDGITGATGDQRASITPMAAAQQDLSNKWEDFATRIGPALTTMLTGVVTAMDNLLGIINAGIDAWGRITKAGSPGSDIVQGILGGLFPAWSLAQKVQGHAAGGPVGAGVPTWVGEQGPEVFVPQGNGMILNRAQMTTVLRGGFGGGSPSSGRHCVHNVTLMIDKYVLGQVLDAENGRQFALMGTGALGA